MPITSHLSIPLIMAHQSQKEVTVNEALTTIDAVLNTGAISQGDNTPPVSPADGDVYIIGSDPLGAWSGKGNYVAYFQEGWKFISPREGMGFWVNDEDTKYSFDGSDWIISSGFTGGELQEVSLLGVNATADSTNKLTVKSNAILFATDSGNVQLKINKPGSGDVASTLFQTSYSGRAEWGLIGDDDFQLKVSPDGSSFYQSMIVDKSSGDVDFKQDVNITGTLTGVDINDLDDVTITSVASNDFLVHSGSVWINKTPSAARSSLGVVIGTDVQAYDTNISKVNTAETQRWPPLFRQFSSLAKVENGLCGCVFLLLLKPIKNSKSPAGF